MNYKVPFLISNPIHFIFTAHVKHMAANVQYI